MLQDNTDSTSSFVGDGKRRPHSWSNHYKQSGDDFEGQRKRRHSTENCITSSFMDIESKPNDNSNHAVENNEIALNKNEASSLQKHVRFDRNVRVILVPKRIEYIQAGLGSILWWQNFEFKSMKMSAVREIMSAMIVHREEHSENDISEHHLLPVNLEGTKEFMRKLYQPVSSDYSLNQDLSDMTCPENCSMSDDNINFEESTTNIENDAANECAQHFIGKCSLNNIDAPHEESYCELVGEDNCVPTDIFSNRVKETLLLMPEGIQNFHELEFSQQSTRLAYKESGL
jgi:hypothetical protein